MSDNKVIPLSELRRLMESATPGPWQEWIYRDPFPTEVRTAGSAPINYGRTPRHTFGPDGFVPYGDGPAYSRSHICTMTEPRSTGHGSDPDGLLAAEHAANADARLIVALRNYADALIEAAEERDKIKALLLMMPALACKLCSWGNALVGTVNGKLMHANYCGGPLEAGDTNSCRCGPKPCAAQDIHEALSSLLAGGKS